MTNYWPKRPSAKGFSIANLSKQYREKLKNISRGSNNTQFKAADSSLKVSQLGLSTLSFDESSLCFAHWANRDFREYIHTA